MNNASIRNLEFLYDSALLLKTNRGAHVPLDPSTQATMIPDFPCSNGPPYIVPMNLFSWIYSRIFQFMHFSKIKSELWNKNTKQRDPMLYLFILCRQPIFHLSALKTLRRDILLLERKKSSHPIMAWNPGLEVYFFPPILRHFCYKNVTNGRPTKVSILLPRKFSKQRKRISAKFTYIRCNQRESNILLNFWIPRMKMSTACVKLERCPL